MTQTNKAIVFAAKAHGDQRRKYTGASYIVHPIEVMGILMAHDITDDDVLAAALLHDVVEDTPVGPETLIMEGFNARVVGLVLEVTDVSKPNDGNRAYRKGLDRLHLAKASPDGQNIKLADLMSNTVDITKGDPGFAKVYLVEKTHLLGVLTRGDDSLYAQAWIVLNKAQDDLLQEGLKELET